MIGKWIDEMCRHEPELMRELLEAPEGSLDEWVDEDEDCGCLVGTVGILLERRLGVVLDPTVPVREWMRQGFARSTVPEWVVERAVIVGMHVSSVVGHLYRHTHSSWDEAEARLWKLMKARIARRLADQPVEPSFVPVLVCRK